MEDLNRTIESSTKSAVRVTVATSRYRRRRNEIQGNASHDEIASFVMVTDGQTAIVSGFGYLIDNFIRTKQLSGYPGQDANVSVLADDNYGSAKLKLMRFDQTFDKMPYDASQRNALIFYSYHKN